MATGSKHGKPVITSGSAAAETAVFYVTADGSGIARKLKGLYPNASVYRFKVESIGKNWNRFRRLIFIMAAGIVVRTIAPLIGDKQRDPAVVVIDEKGRHVISLLSGHIGGANELTREIAAFLGGEPVITTASDLNSLAAIDLWARDNNLLIDDTSSLKGGMMRLLRDGHLRVYSDGESTAGLNIPVEFLRVDNPETADIIITNKLTLLSPRYPTAKNQVYLRQHNLVVGIGCNSNTSADEIEHAVEATLMKYNLSPLSIRSLATIDVKIEEPGLVDYAKRHNYRIDSYSKDELNSAVFRHQHSAISHSEAAFRATGAKAVAEPAALLSAGTERLLVPKQKIGNVTVAVAEAGKGKDMAGGETEEDRGKIYIVGTGPGGIEHITPSAVSAIRDSDVIVGYGTYLNLIQDLINGKDVFSTGMTKEVERCKKAVELAMEGKKVSVISGGDPGIYAMAGLVFEMLKERTWTQDSENHASCIMHHASFAPYQLPPVEVIPGISALNACAARLGAPLMHDFACISLSDRLTPWELIERRLKAASASDFVIVLYNPKSKGRVEHLKKAGDIILRHRPPLTPVGIVRAAMRNEESMVITTLAGMSKEEVDMQTTVIIGNSQTFLWENRMITPRGYEEKFRT